jgi:hypothetical protein
MILYRILGGISCAALAFANLIPTTGTQSPLMSNPTVVNGKLRYKANSNICETTPGVNQKSGYVTVGQNMSMVSSVQGHYFTITCFFNSGSGSLNHGHPQKRRPSHFGLFYRFGSNGSHNHTFIFIG